MSAKVTLSSRFLSSSPRQMEDTHSPYRSSVFRKSVCPFLQKGGGGVNYEGSVKFMIGSVIGCINECHWFYCSKSKKLLNSF